MRTNTKLTIAFLTLYFLTLIVITLISRQMTVRFAVERETEHLQAIADIQKREIEHALKEHPADVFSFIMKDYTGLGRTGEIVLAKRDENGHAVFIAPTRFDPQAAYKIKVLKSESNVLITRALLKQERVISDYIDYRGVRVIGVTRYIPRADWGLVVKMDRDEVLAPAGALVRSELFVIMIFSGLVMIIIPFFSRLVTAELERNEERLRALEKLRDDLTKMIVHDLKNPLAAIGLGLDLLLSGELGQLRPEQKKQLEMIKRGENKLLLLIMNILNISKMESGKLQLNRTMLPAESLTRHLAWLSDLAAEEGKTIEIAAEKGLVINADQDLLVRVLENLLMNAVRHSGRGGRIDLNIKQAGREIMFEVSDHGAGIAKETLPRLFEKYFSVAKDRGPGRTDTGLGLAFCKLAVEAHGGRIGVESEPGRGARFYFYLPG